MKRINKYFLNPILITILMLIAWLEFYVSGLSTPLTTSQFIHPLYQIVILILLSKIYIDPLLKQIKTTVIHSEITQLEKEEYQDYIKTHYAEYFNKTVSMSTRIKLGPIPTINDYIKFKKIGPLINLKYKDYIINFFVFYVFGGAILLFIKQPPYSISNCIAFINYLICTYLLYLTISEKYLKSELIELIGAHKYKTDIHPKLNLLSDTKTILFITIIILSSLLYFIPI